MYLLNYSDEPLTFWTNKMRNDFIYKTLQSVHTLKFIKKSEIDREKTTHKNWANDVIIFFSFSAAAITSRSHNFICC